MRRVFHGLIVLPLILAVGGHWAFLQSVAWVGMAVEYSQDAPLIEALAKTFSGAHPCNLCKAVDAGQKAERKEAVLKAETKLEFPAADVALTVLPQVLLEFGLSATPLPLVRNDSPPTPPPRTA